MRVEDVLTSSGQGGAGSIGLPYRVPKTYLRRNKLEDSKKGPNRNLSADGPAYTVSKSKRVDILKHASYGKDGKEPPHSYLNLRLWTHAKDKKGAADERGKSAKRATYIDDVIAYHNKFKYPGPDQYQKPPAKKDSKKKDPKDSKPPPKPNYLNEAEYIGLNNPAPGDYNVTV